MLKSCSIKEELFKIKRYQEYPVSNKKRFNEKRQTLMTVALINAGIFSSMNVKGHRYMFSEGEGGIF
jgi:hypothetical protein